MRMVVLEKRLSVGSGCRLPHFSYLWLGFVAVSGNHVLQLPLVYVDCEHLLVEQTSAEWGFLIGVLEVIFKFFQQLFPNQHWHRIGTWVHVVKEHERPKQHFPMVSNQGNQTAPVHGVAGGIHDVRDVGTVKPFSEGHKYLRSDQLFRREHFRGYTQDFRVEGAADPGVIHTDDGVAHSRNEVDEVFSMLRFAK